MQKQFDLLIFDWDGTLMDSTGAIAKSIRAACADLALPVPSIDQANHIIGLGLTEAIAVLLPELPAADYPQLVERYRYHFLGQDHLLPLFDGVTQTIPQLHDAGYWVTVATGKSRRGLERALDQSRLRQYFHASRCADEVFSKPHPGMILELMDYCGVHPERTLMIGDTSHDLQMAQNAGVASVGVGYGAHCASTLQAFNPLYIADDFAALAKWLNEHG
jgi:haloacid dehalogenase superfamily, subfamily IA, variant 3 with third motif having DD or ED/haloacid dehalogenase superfamily, subfamily IA, variant 1 with third motif having Dx(3-4)D or Dx(3-4)E